MGGENCRVLPASQRTATSQSMQGSGKLPLYPYKLTGCVSISGARIQIFSVRLRHAASEESRPRRYSRRQIKSRRPITNLPVISKLLERIVARAACEISFFHLTENGLLSDLQSAYRRVYHSTETAVLEVIADILLATWPCCSLLDLLAAFDIVDHFTFPQWLETCGIGVDLDEVFTS